MPFKFRKSLKIAPGVKINLSKGGISTSVGGKGHSINIGKRGVKTTVGIPGTGMSYTTSSASASTKKKSPGCGGTAAILLFLTTLSFGFLFAVTPAHASSAIPAIPKSVQQSPMLKPTYPPGATALCKDGTFSWSQHRRGTCSRHGGVKKWIKKVAK